MQDLIHWFTQNTTGNHHRRLLVIQDQRDWSLEVCEALQKHTQDNSLWVNTVPETSPDNDKTSYADDQQYRRFLGQEYQFLVYDAHITCRANALIALSGTVTSAGTMVILLPQLEAQDKATDSQAASIARQWLNHHIKTDPSVAYLNKATFVAGQRIPLPANSGHDRNKEQTQAIQQIIRVALGKRNKPLVLTADRGRGKTSALGIAAADLLQQGHNVIICAPTRHTVEQAFIHCKQSLAPASIIQYSSESIRVASATFQFYPPDVLIAQQPDARLVIVDEAAAIPIPQLKKLQQHYGRLVFSSTIHGYEGSGRGFELRFLPYLKQLSRDLQRFHLNTPLRWYSDDPLEQFWFRCFLYKDKLTALEPAGLALTGNPTANDVIFETLESHQFIEQQSRLAQAFILLLDAHYQTTPDDLWRLLTTEHKLLIVRQQHRVLAAAIVCHEGGSETAIIADQILAGKRRRFGHLLPQNLALNSQLKPLLSCQYTRIVRIAVSPNYQASGIGSQLLRHISTHCNSSDFIGTTFAATQQLVRFWQRNHFQFIRLGTRQDSASGEHSAMMLMPLTTSAITLQQQLIRLRNLDFMALMPRHYQFVSRALLVHLLKDVLQRQRLHDSYHRQLTHFAAGGSSNTVIPAWHFAVHNDNRWLCLGQLDTELLIDYFIFNKTINELVHQHQLTGKKQLEQQLRRITQNWLSLGTNDDEYST